MLQEGEYTKNEIIERFASVGIQVTRPLIIRYIEQFQNYGVKVCHRVNEHRQKVYYINKADTNLEFTREEMDAISDAKKLLIAQKNYDRIRKTMRLFYKLAKCMKDKDMLREFVDFGYYSTVNWYLVKQLEKHCKQKDVIALRYIVPQGECRIITIHADALKVSNWSQRLYLHGVFEGSKHFSHLPVDRIFMIKNVVKRSKRFDIVTNMLTYVVSKKLYEKMYVDAREKIVETNGDKVTIERPIDDDFYLIQRLLSFCPEIYYISDERIKTLFKEKLEILKASYDDTIDR